MENSLTALWLIPEPAFLAPCHSVIRELSVKFGGPSFPPHVTLVSGIVDSAASAIQRTGQLAGSIPPFDITVVRIGHSDEYFRAIFLELEHRPEIMDARVRALELLAHQDGPPFFPHLSLAYGRIDGAHAESECARIRSQLPRRFTLGALELVRASAASDVSTWRNLRTFPLGVE